MRIEEMLDAIHETRLLVFLECNGADSECEWENDTNHFHQVLLTPAQFKKVSDAVIVEEETDITLKPRYKRATLNLNHTLAPEPFEGLSSHT